MKKNNDMDWLIFGDDWGAHPSTTQHLARHLPAKDNIVWVNSIGMRSPGLHTADLVRMAKKAKSMLLSKFRSAGRAANQPPNNMLIIDLPLLPWHRSRAIKILNQFAFDRIIKKALRRKGMFERQVTVLAANPVVAFYLKALPYTHLAYLRLDDYSHLPGVDSTLATLAEERMVARASLVFATARSLMLEDKHVRSIYLPQGVDWHHFAQVPSRPPGNKIVGFHGLLAEWIDYKLIRSVAVALPDWSFEFVGPVRTIPDWLNDIKNLRLLPAVAYQQLPSILTRWDAAWIPFRIDTLTKSVNPLKLREYLAAGLPTLCTPLPEARALGATIESISSPEQAVDCLLRIHKSDNATLRKKRKQSVTDQDWSNRSSELRESLQNLQAPAARR